MTRELPDWQPFDPSAGPVPPAVASRSPEPSGGRVVVVAPTGSVEDGGWAARATVALAREWGSGGGKLFLADLSLRHPVLHEALGTANGEGISDALLYGASIRRIAVSTDEPFFFAPAGTVVADAEPVLSHPRWEVLAQGFASAGVTLVLYTPLELPGASSLLDRASEVVLLATESEAAAAPLDGAEEKVVLVLGPGGGAEVEAAAGVGTGAGGGAAGEAGEARLDEAAAVVAAEEPAPEPARPEPARRGRRTQARKRSSRVEVLVLLLVLVLGGALLGAYYGVLDVPWLTPYLEQLDGDAGPAAGEDAPRAPATPPAGEGSEDAPSPQP